MDYLRQSSGHTVKPQLEAFNSTQEQTLPKFRFATSIGYGKRHRGYNSYVFADAALEPPKIVDDFTETKDTSNGYPLPVGLGYGSRHSNYSRYVSKLNMTAPAPKDAGEVNPAPVESRYLAQGLGYGPWHRDYFMYKYAHDRKVNDGLTSTKTVHAHKDALDDHLNDRLLPSAIGYGNFHRDYHKARDSHHRAPVLPPRNPEESQDGFRAAGALGYGDGHRNHATYVQKRNSHANTANEFELQATVPQIALHNNQAPVLPPELPSQTHFHSTRNKFRGVNRNVDQEPYAGNFPGSGVPQWSE